jgi:hypothetical protein
MELRAFLNQVKIIADSIDIIDYKDEAYRDEDYGRSSIYKLERIPSIDRIVKPSWGAEILETNSMASMGYAETFYNLFDTQIIAEYLSGSYCSMNNTFIPNCIMGVNKASKETELAKDFIRYVFSEESQSTLKYGYPINIAAFNSVEDSNNSYKGIIHFYSEKDDKVGHIYFEAINISRGKMDSMINQLKTPVYNNDTVIKIIVEKALPYFTGEEELDTVCQDIINKVNLYLSE